MTMAAGTLLDRIVTKEFHDDPALILGELNRLLDQILRQGGENHIEDGLDAGILFIPAQGGTARFAGAGISLFVADGSNLQEIRGDRHGIGYASFNRGMTFSLRELVIHSGMSFYLSTDGIRDQIGETTGLPFGRTRLNELLSSLQGLSMGEQRNRIVNVVREYKGKQSVRDDQTLFAITI